MPDGPEKLAEPYCRLSATGPLVSGSLPQICDQRSFSLSERSRTSAFAFSTIGLRKGSVRSLVPDDAVSDAKASTSSGGGSDDEPRSSYENSPTFSSAKRIVAE